MWEKLKWYQIDKMAPPDGVRLILKMADDNHNVHYGIGIIDQGQKHLRILAQENSGATRAIYWMMPD